jgi:hypothetical protein
MPRARPRIAIWWEAEFLRNEAVAALLVATGLIVLSEVVLGPARLDRYLDANRFTVFSQLAALLGALLGLVIAAGALVLDRVAEGRLRLVSESRHGPKLWRTFKSAMVWLGWGTLLAVAVLVPTNCATADRVVIYAWLVAALLVVVRLARTIWIVGLLMDLVDSQARATGSG